MLKYDLEVNLSVVAGINDDDRALLLTADDVAGLGGTFVGDAVEVRNFPSPPRAQ